MHWCTHCTDNHPTHQTSDGFAACSACGRVLIDNTSSGRTTIKSQTKDNHLSRGESTIRDVAAALGAAGGEPLIRDAHDLFAIAVGRENFPRERIRTRVAAVCLYFALRRRDEGPRLLISFADYLKVGVYVLAALFVALCRILGLESHPFVQRPLDPSLFIHRCSRKLLGRNDTKIPIVALRIVASVNAEKDLIRTGQVPNRLVGAALYISALAHGHRCSKADVMRVVGNTELGCLTIDEFVSMVGEAKGVPCSSQRLEMVCEHKNRGRAHFAHGLCGECYDVLVDFSGLEGPDRPPSFCGAIRQRIEDITRRSNSGRTRKALEMGEEPLDIDDKEIDMYINTTEEKIYKAMIWEAMNSEYLEQQAAKKAQCAAKPTKEKKQRRGKKSMNTSTTGNAQLPNNKRSSSRINYDALAALYGDEKRQRRESDRGIDDEQITGSKECNMALDADIAENNDESALVEYDAYLGDGDEDYGDYDEGFGDGDDYGF
ncbi:uncharacterized protein M6B38_413040 [Iris pallida]|uniref:Brf1 TBP-binding domain-containing protein n=1 Tax=Iris pallida TaxID=29817 RepID=A0AAX6FL41_IRIPA|nr:uncharacterized protein M6B38_413040 [Iris pallida]